MVFAPAIAGSYKPWVVHGRAMQHRRQWRDYATKSGNRPVKEFLLELSSLERADVVEAMNEVRLEGLKAARHLRGDIYEVRADSGVQSFRVLFAAEGRYKQVLLSVVAFRRRPNVPRPE
jgi:phage-related protein